MFENTPKPKIRSRIVANKGQIELLIFQEDKQEWVVFTSALTRADMTNVIASYSMLPFEFVIED